MEHKSSKGRFWRKRKEKTSQNDNQPCDNHGAAQKHLSQTVASSAVAEPDAPSLVTPPPPPPLPPPLPSGASSSSTVRASQQGQSEGLSISERLWSNAYQSLKKREPALMECYEQNLSPGDMSFTSPEQMQTAIGASLENRDARQLIVTLVGKPIKVREYGEKLVKFIAWSKDSISAAIRAEPHAALAWAGVTLLLPLALNPSQETGAMLQGLDSIADLIQIYKIREDLYLKSRPHIEFEETITQLYSEILEYQARMLCHLSQKPLTRAFQSITKSGQWDDMLKAVQHSSDRCLQHSDLINTKLEREQWDREQLQMQQTHQVQELILEELKAQQRSRATDRDDDRRRDFFHAFSSKYSEDKDFNPKRVPGTCEWLFDDIKFRTWRDAETSSILWISADPGCGKSVLSRCLIDEGLVTCRFMTSTVCYFFFKEGQDGRQTGADALSAILHQLYSAHLDNSLMNYALEKFRIHGKSLCGMFGELWSILAATAHDSTAGEVICILDALDECEVNARERLLSTLVSFYSAESLQNHPTARLKFLVTSRPYSSIQLDFHPLAHVANFIHFEGEDRYDMISKDISLVIEDRLPRIMGSRLNMMEQQQIIEHLKSKDHRTYLWLHLVLDLIKENLASYGTEKKVKSLINALPSSVVAAYEQILNKSSDQAAARIILQIVLASRRPLTVSEMKVAFALATSDQHDSYEDLDLQQDDAFKSSLRDICGHFISVHDSKLYLIHQTAREFLLLEETESIDRKAPQRERRRWHHTIDLRDADHLMSKICVRLLAFKLFATAPLWQWQAVRWFQWSLKEDEIVEQYPLLQYASEHWSDHCQPIQERCDIVLLRLALSILEVNSGHFRTWYPIYCHSRLSDVTFENTSLVIASELGLHKLLQSQLVHLCGDERTEKELFRALQAASVNGHEKMVQQLLENGAEVNAQGGTYGNALQATSFNGHEKVVQLLLDKGAEVNAQGGSYGNALQAACVEGHEKVVQLLLDRRAEVNAQGGKHGSALYAASVKGHEKVVQLLLDKGAEVNAQGGSYGNALQAASVEGHEKVVQLLLDKGAEVNAQGGSYGNALQAACVKGHEKVVQLLLDQGAEVNAQGGIYGNSLQAASFNGHEKVVQLLLDKGAEVNAQGGSYGNALQTASFRAHEKVVQLLLDKGAEINAQGGSYGNALQAASVEGHEKVVQLLLDQGAEINAQGGSYGNALQAASFNGHEKVVQLLLDKGAEVNAQGGSYGNALQAACVKGHEKVVQLLLDQGAEVNAQGGIYGNSLQAASFNGHEKVVQLLLDKGAEVNAQGGSYGNALQTASFRAHEKVVQLLLDKGAEINAQGGSYGNALQAASVEGHEKVVQLLLDQGAEINAQGGSYGNALQAASFNGHEKVVQLLLDKGAEVNAQGGSYGNALQAASVEGHEKVVQLLLDRRAEVNAQGGKHGSALYAASVRGHEKVVQLLLDAGAEVDMEGGRCAKVLYGAHANGRDGVIKLPFDEGANYELPYFVSHKHLRVEKLTPTLSRFYAGDKWHYVRDQERTQRC